jgi:hypothetical protein
MTATKQLSQSSWSPDKGTKQPPSEYKPEVTLQKKWNEIINGHGSYTNPLIAREICINGNDNAIHPSLNSSITLQLTMLNTNSALNS